MSTTMRALVITRPGGPEVLEVREAPRPVPAPHELLVRVRAGALNRADLLQRRGRYPAPPGSPADIPGLEVAGEVEALGAAVTAWHAGDRVMGLVGGGGHAEYALLHERAAIAVPPSLSWEEAGAVPEAYITAHDALFARAGLRLGERVLIHAVGSGVGVAALQLAKAAGALVIGTSRSAWKLERATALGLDLAIDVETTGFADAVERATEGAGVHVILDLVGGPYLAGNLRVLAPLGRAVVVGLVAGGHAPLELDVLLRKRLTLIGTALRGRAPEEKIDAARRAAIALAPLLADGRARPVIDRVHPLEEAGEAHAFMESNGNFGKIVLRI